MRWFQVLMVFLTVLPAWAAEVQKPQDQLIYQASIGQGSDITYLVKQGASPNTRDKKGVPVLALAAARMDKNSAEAVLALIMAKADLELLDANGQSALFYAARVGNIKSVQQLLAAGAKVYLVDAKGNIARTIAYQNKHPEVVKAMDDFVIQQTQKMVDDYEKNTKLLKEKQGALNAATITEKKQGLELQKLEREAQWRAYNEAKAKADEEQKKLDAERSPEKFKTLVYDVSYNACASNYLKLCEKSNSGNAYVRGAALKKIVAQQKKTSQDAEAELIRLYHADQRYIDNITDQSRQYIKNYLDGFSSPEYRREQGACREDDVEEQCATVADSWDIAPKTVSVPVRREGVAVNPARENTRPIMSGQGWSR